MFLRYTTAKKAMQLEDSMWCLQEVRGGEIDDDKDRDILPSAPSL
jgi:hypothetical protein